jgi:hypothetical protein
MKISTIQWLPYIRFPFPCACLAVLSFGRLEKHFPCLLVRDIILPKPERVNNCNRLTGCLLIHTLLAHLRMNVVHPAILYPIRPPFYSSTLHNRANFLNKKVMSRRFEAQSNHNRYHHLSSKVDHNQTSKAGQTAVQRRQINNAEQLGNNAKQLGNNAKQVGNAKHTTHGRNSPCSL